MGIENQLSKKEITEADMIVFANDVSISKLERFDNVKDKIKQFAPHAVIKNPSIIFND